MTLNLRRLSGRIALALTMGVLVLANPASSDAAVATAGCQAPWGSLPMTAETTSTAPTHLVNIRSGRHDCYDRLVLDLDGPAHGYDVRYVDEVRQDGSGNLVPLRGGAFLRVFTARAYDESGSATYAPADNAEVVPVGGYRTFRQVAFAGSFEGRTTIGIGVRARLPFRVFTVDGPGAGSRLVIDVAHQWYPTSTKTVDVYYSTGDGSDCAEVSAFPRDATGVTAPIGYSLDQLLAGPTGAEKSQGASSWFSLATADAVRSVNLRNGLLTVDFADIRSVIPGASTSCGSAALLAELNSTVFQFPAVQRVRYQILGSCDTFHEWLQTTCHNIDR
jgi:hypothetical protein